VSDVAVEQIAAEVMELGEMLFETMIEAAEQKQIEGNLVDVDIIEEMRAAADEYFTAVRLILRVKQPTTLPDRTDMS